MNMKLYFIVSCILCVNLVQADQLLLNEWKNGISSEINLLSSIVNRLELLENTNIMIEVQKIHKFEKRINDLEVEVNELKEYKENTQKKLYSLEQVNEALIEHINKCNQELDEIKRLSSSTISDNNNNIRSNNVGGARRLLSTNDNNNQAHSGITMNDGTSIRFIHNNNANTVELTHENGVLKLNGTLQLNNDINDVNNAIKELQSHVSSTTKTINVPSDYATITAAIASLKSVHYNQVIIQLSPGTYNENIIIDREIVIPRGLVIRGDRVDVGSYIFNVSSGAYAISVTKPINKLLIDGISIEGLGNGIYIENGHVEIGNVNISISGQYGIFCTGSQSYLRLLTDSTVKITTQNIGIAVFYLATAKVGGTLMINGPGRNNINSLGINLYNGGHIHFTTGNVFIKDFGAGIRLHFGSDAYQYSENSLLNISYCRTGIQVYYGCSLYFNWGNTNIDVPTDGYVGMQVYASTVILDWATITTPAASSAEYAIAALVNSYVYTQAQNIISSNWNVQKIYIAQAAVFTCSGSYCPAASVNSLSYYNNGAQYCASESTDCNAV